MGGGVDEMVVLSPALAYDVGEARVACQILTHSLPQPLERPGQHNGPHIIQPLAKDQSLFGTAITTAHWEMAKWTINTKHNM